MPWRNASTQHKVPLPYIPPVACPDNIAVPVYWTLITCTVLFERLVLGLELSRSIFVKIERLRGGNHLVPHARNRPYRQHCVMRKHEILHSLASLDFLNCNIYFIATQKQSEITQWHCAFNSSHNKNPTRSLRKACLEIGPLFTTVFTRLHTNG